MGKFHTYDLDEAPEQLDIFLIDGDRGTRKITLQALSRILGTGEGGSGGSGGPGGTGGLTINALSEFMRIVLAEEEDDQIRILGYFDVYNREETVLHGYMGAATGSADGGETLGVAMTYGVRPDRITDDDIYVIVTEAGARMQAKGTSLYVIESGAFVNGKRILTEADFQKTKKLDFSGWDAGYFEETLSTNDTIRYSVTFDSAGAPIQITDGGGHAMDIVWPLIIPPNSPDPPEG